MAVLTIDPNYGYVLLAATSTFVLGTIHGLNTSKYRKAAKVDYPAAYAPSTRTDAAALQFNSAQRAHANYIENQPSMLGALILAGLRYPLSAAAMGFGWTVLRYLYMRGYSNGTEGGKGRYPGLPYIVFHLGLIGLCGWSGISMILEK